MRRVLMAAALVALALNLSASNFTGADQVYLPAAANMQGSTGRFVSDVYLSNLSGDTVDVTVIYQPIGAGGGAGMEYRNLLRLRGHERREYKNFLANVLGLTGGSDFGILIFNGCLAGAGCGPEVQDANGDSPNFRPIDVTSRVYSFPTGPGANPALTTGQLFNGVPWYHLVSGLQANNGLDKVYIRGLRQTGAPGQVGTFRSNIGLVNASQYSRTDIVVFLYQGTMTSADRKGEYRVTLEPLGSVQIGFSTAFPDVSGENYFITVEQRDPAAVGAVPSACVLGCPAFLAYGSVLDNGTGDATTLEAAYLTPLNGAALTTIYPSPSGRLGVRRSVRH